jgi:UDP-glucuronate decarboxylase
VHYQFDPVQTVKTNVHGAINMLGLARRMQAAILQASTSEVYGDGQQTRSFCFVSDLVEAFVRFMSTPDDLTGPLNLGNPGEFTMRELAEKVIAITGSRSAIVNRPLPPDDPVRRRPDISQARAALDWQPTVTLDEGLRQTIAYFEHALSRA